MNKLTSLTIFFPFYNDAGTVEKALEDAYSYGRMVTDDLEVIAIHGGDSEDETFKEILKGKKKHPDLVVIDKKTNRESYAVIKWGFYRSSRDWVFYTDGDLQYNLKDLLKLVSVQNKTSADVVNGYKKTRRDNIVRILLGSVYRFLSKNLFKLPIRDLTCDFRLIRRDLLRKIKFQAKDASIVLELIKKLDRLGAKFAEVEVGHRKRAYGRSTYSLTKLIKERVFGDIKFFFTDLQS